MEGDMPKKDMGLKKKNLTGYMGGGVFKPNAPISSSFRGGGATEVGTENKVESYKEYAKKMFGGGGTSDTYMTTKGEVTKPASGFFGMKTGGVKKGKKMKSKKPKTTFRPTKADDRGM